MKKIIAEGNILILFALCIATVALSCNNSEVQNHNSVEKSKNLIFPKGQKVTNDNFTGTVYLHSLIESDSMNPNNVGNVTFEPGARSKWHLHPAGQILLATDGVGYYQEQGKSKKILRKGDVIKCPPNTPHWHGASVDTAFVQVAITGRENGQTVWMQPVSNEDYTAKP